MKEITNARAGKGHHMQHDLYSVEGALMYLDEYFVSEPYDRPGDGPLLLAVSLSSPHYPYQCPEELFSHYLRRVEPYVEDLPENFDCDDFFKVRVGRDVTWRERTAPRPPTTAWSSGWTGSTAGCSPGWRS